MTFAEFETLPETEATQELLDGELIERPPEKLSHMRLVQDVYFHLAGILPKSRVWMETGYRIGDGWLIPDVSVTWPKQEITDDYLIRSPMIAVEIASPFDTAPKFEEKIVAYLDDGAAELWAIYPKLRSMTVHVAADRSARRYRGTYECALLSTTIPIDELIGQ